MQQGRNEENPLQLERPSEMANHQPPQAQKCPRCDSFSTKFCYYNNYSLSQPRHFCKTCRRYWTQGGTLRNVPVGGGCRKTKRGRTMSSNSLAAGATQGLPPIIRTQSFTRMTSDQPLRHAAPLIDNSFFTGGSFLSSLAAMHTLPTNQGVPVNIDGNGGNMTILQGGVSLPFLKSPTSLHQYSPSSTHYFQPQQSLVRPGTFNSWNQSLINKGGASSSSMAATSSFLSGNDQSSFTPNQWSYTHSEFNPF